MAAVQRQGGNFPQQGQQQQNFQPGRQGSQPPQQDGGANVGPAGVLKVAAIDPSNVNQSDTRRTKSGRFTMSQLRQTDGIVPLQYGTNQFDSQKGMTNFGTPRDVRGKHLKRIWELEFPDEEVVNQSGAQAQQQAQANGQQQFQQGGFQGQQQGFQQQQGGQQRAPQQQQGFQGQQQGFQQNQPQQNQPQQQQGFQQQGQPQQQQFQQQQRAPQQQFQGQPQQGFQQQGFNQQQQALKSPPAFR